jgi:acetyl esterase/lipase
MRIASIGVGMILVALLTVAACSPLKAFNAVVPKDAGATILASGIAYGEGPRRKLDVYAPNPMDRPKPVIIFFYGGSWNSGARAGYSFVGHALAAAGFVVMIPDYRLVPETRFPGFLEDNAAAVRWARTYAPAFGGDPERLILAGHSAGAYNAAMLALDPRWLGADRARVRGWIGLAGPYDFLPLATPSTIEAFSRWPRPEETQPVSFADAGDPPALIATGAEDQTVRPRNSESLTAKLRAAGVAVTAPSYSGIGHAGVLTSIALPFRSRAPVLADMIAFARQVTAPAERGLPQRVDAQAKKEPPHEPTGTDERKGPLPANARGTPRP